MAIGTQVSQAESYKECPQSWRRLLDSGWRTTGRRSLVYPKKRLGQEFPTGTPWFAKSSNHPSGQQGVSSFWSEALHARPQQGKRRKAHIYRLFERCDSPSSLQVFRGRKFNNPSWSTDPWFDNWAFMNDHTPDPDFSEERNDTENKLRFLSFAQVIPDDEGLLSFLITRFRNLETITLKKVTRRIRADGTVAPYTLASQFKRALSSGKWAYEDTAVLEAKLKAFWAKDDEKRGLQRTPNKIQSLTSWMTLVSESILQARTIYDRSEVEDPKLLYGPQNTQHFIWWILGSDLHRHAVCARL